MIDVMSGDLRIIIMASRHPSPPFLKHDPATLQERTRATCKRKRIGHRRVATQTHDLLIPTNITATDGIY